MKLLEEARAGVPFTVPAKSSLLKVRARTLRNGWVSLLTSTHMFVLLIDRRF